MSVLQEQAIQMVRGLSDDNVSFLIEVIQRLMSQKLYVQAVQPQEKNEAIEAFQRLNAARTEIKQYLPEDFDPDKGLEEARAEGYVPVISPEKLNCEKQIMKIEYKQGKQKSDVKYGIVILMHQIFGFLSRKKRTIWDS